MKPPSHVASETRELTDKELNTISRAMGDVVRSQSTAITHLILENLKAAFVVRNNAASLTQRDVRRSGAA
jgi:hypothetical protein